jgi:molecular chaperone GrpE
MSSENNAKTDKEVESEILSGGGEDVLGATPDAAVSQLQVDLEKFRDLALRSQADFENYRKRSIREREEAVKFANFSLVEKLMPILDNFDLGLEAARASDGAAQIVSGMEMVRKQIEDFLTQIGVETLKAEGADFDPNLHEAVAQEPHADIAEGKVIRQLRKGYRLRDRLVRAALVVVSGGPA